MFSELLNAHNFTKTQTDDMVKRSNPLITENMEPLRNNIRSSVANVTLSVENITHSIVNIITFCSEHYHIL